MLGYIHNVAGCGFEVLQLLLLLLLFLSFADGTDPSGKVALRMFLRLLYGYTAGRSSTVQGR